MQFNLPVEGASNGGSEQASSSDDGQFLVALRKMMKKEVEVMVIRAVQQIVPTIGSLVRKIVKEEIQSVEKRLLTEGTRFSPFRNANEMSMSMERSLLLKFLDEVSVPVLTGKVLKGKGDDSLRVALVDRATGEVVGSGPESSAKVEILVLDANDDDNEHNWSLENFNRRIIREGDKKKPHFAKNVYVYLKEGVGVLSNVKLGHGANWMRSCKCRLGARIVQNFRGINVQEATTELFTVLDSRSKLYEKHYPPSLSDEVWRLDNIGRDGPPSKRLDKEKIWTVQDFLFMLSIDPQRLQEIVRAPAKMWKATVDHALSCMIDDKNIYLYYPPTEPKKGVAFDAVGGLKGLVNESQYVPFDKLSPDEKDCAQILLLSAFENRDKRYSFDDESSLLQKFPYRTDVNTSTNLVSDGSSLSFSENIHGDYYPTEPGTSSQSNITTFDNPYYPSRFSSPEWLEEQIRSYHLCCPDLIFDNSGDNWGPISVTNSEIDNLSETHMAEQERRARTYSLVGPVVNAMLWVLRAKKKRVLALGDVHVQKKQRI